MRNSSTFAERPGIPVRPLEASTAQAAESDPLKGLGAAVRFEKNRTIYYESDEAKYYYKVRSGTVRLCKVTEDGRRQIAAFLMDGEVFGWTDQDIYNFSAEAVTDVVVEKYSCLRVEETVKANPSMGRRILSMLLTQLASAHEHLLLLGRMTASERIASFLLELGRRQNVAMGNGGTIELSMSRKDMADYLGLTVETVSRTMSALKRKGIIAFVEPENVELKQGMALERLAMAA